MRSFWSLLVLLPVCIYSQPPGRWAEIDQPAKEAELRSAIADIEQLSHDLHAGLKRYQDHLRAALAQNGYGPYHPIFRTSLNGFEQDQIDLDDLDEFKMGHFAYLLRNAGRMLDPNPFTDWEGIQKSLEMFDARMNHTWSVVARSNIFVAHSRENIPSETLHKLRKQWAAIEGQVVDAYGHAMAVRAVSFEDGEIVPVPANVRRIFGGGRYAVICAFGVCTSQADVHDGEGNPIALVH